MLGVVIIDDEQVICDLIRSLVHWDQQGLTFLGAAHDGFSAMELIQEKKPDIGVIDIRIPGMDGIEVIEKARKVSPGTRFIVVSGYREFDYARQACSLYVSEYLVKPIDEDELNAALGKICRERALEQAGREEQEKLAQQIKDQRKYILQTAVRDMQKGTFAWSGEQPFSFQGLPFHKQRYTVVIVKFDIRYEMIDPCRPIMAYVRKLFETGNGPDTEVYILEEDSRLVLFIGHDHENLPELREKTVIANEYVKAYQYCRISFGLSAAGGMAENLPGLYAEAISASELRRSRYNGIIRYDKTVPRIDYFRETEEKTGGWIRQALSEGSFDPLAQMLEERYAAFREKGAEYGYPLYLIGVIRIFEGMLTGSARARLEKPLGRLCWGIDNEQKLYKIRNEWQESFRELFDQYLVSKLKDENYHITKAQGYISQHFSEELSLQKVADEVHLNAVYFGNLFKSVTGVNFLEYVQLHRIEHAKELLTATDMRIEEVAESSGYRDKRYFSRIFKRIVGMSPGTYRKLYARRQ